MHRKVDTESGAAPLPEDGELRRARSVTLSSERLGVIAKLDLVEGDGGSVVPVDYKKGSPQPDGSPWPSDEGADLPAGAVPAPPGTVGAEALSRSLGRLVVIAKRNWVESQGSSWMVTIRETVDWLTRTPRR